MNKRQTRDVETEIIAFAAGSTTSLLVPNAFLVVQKSGKGAKIRPEILFQHQLRSSEKSIERKCNGIYSIFSWLGLPLSLVCARIVYFVCDVSACVKWRNIQVFAWRARTRCHETHSIFNHFGLVCGFPFDLFAESYSIRCMGTTMQTRKQILPALRLPSKISFKTDNCLYARYCVRDELHQQPAASMAVHRLRLINK